MKSDQGLIKMHRSPHSPRTSRLFPQNLRHQLVQVPSQSQVVSVGAVGSKYLVGRPNVISQTYRRSLLPNDQMAWALDHCFSKLLPDLFFSTADQN